MTPLRQRLLEELQRRNYSPSTTEATSSPSSSLRNTSASRRTDWDRSRCAATNSTCSTRKKLAAGTVKTPHVGLAVLLPEGAQASRSDL